MNIEGWNVVDEAAGLLWREYVFAGRAKATALVFRGEDGLVVISPPSGLAPRDYDALHELGEVRALIANNAYHHLGQSAWRARFPDAVSYCPPAAVKVLEKKTKGVIFRPVGDLRLPANVHLEVAPGFKTGETLLSIRTISGAVWFTGDLLTNIQKTPGPPLSWLFAWADAAPGFRLFKPAIWLMVSNRRSVREWALHRLAEDPPVAVIPAHGPPVEGGDVALRAKAQLERL